MFFATPSLADAFDSIKLKGTLRVGVKADYRPFGFRDSSGKIVGIEPDLAADAAAQLGVKLLLVPVTTTTRIPLLKKGEIDLIAATMSETIDRRADAEFVEPFYYSTHVNLLTLKDNAPKAWSDLKNKRVCGVTGSWFNEVLAEDLSVRFENHPAPDDSLNSVKEHKCEGLLFDEAFILGKLEQPDMATRFSMPLKGILRTPWTMAVAKSEIRLRTFMEELTVKWMRTGRIVELERKWGLAPDGYSLGMADRYRDK